MSTDVTTKRARPEAIKAVPVRHPGRWVAIAVLAVLAAMFAQMFKPPILYGLRGTLALTVLAMLIGVVLGTVLAVMRLSTNPILRYASWLYTWFFRAVPRLVLAILFGNLLILWPRLSVGLPFDTQIGRLFGVDLHAR